MAIFQSALIVLFLTPFYGYSSMNIEDRVYSNAVKRLDNGEYTLAIELFSQLSDEYLSTFPRALNFARAYARRCGVEEKELIERTQILEYPLLSDLVKRGPNLVSTEGSQLADCEASISLLNQSRQEDLMLEEEIFLSYVYIGYIEKMIKLYSDLDDNKTPDAMFDSCSESDLPDFSARSLWHTLVTSKTHFEKIKPYSIGVVILENINLACLEAKNKGFEELCNVDRTPYSYSAREIGAIRTLIGEENSMGIGTCRGDFWECLCI